MSNGDDPLGDIVSTAGPKPRPKTTAAIQAADTTIPKKPTDDPLGDIAKPQDDLLGDIVKPQSAGSLTSILGQTQQAVADYYAAEAAKPAPPPSFRERHPILGFARDMIVDTGLDLSTVMKTFLHSGSPTDPAYTDRFVRYAMSIPEDQREEYQRRLVMGSALIGSFAAGPILDAVLPTVAGPLTEGAARIVAPGPLLGKWGSFVAGEALGGSIYGSIRPREDDETRLQAIAGDAGTFLALGAGGKLLGAIGSRTLKSFISRMPAAERGAVMDAVSEGTDRINEDLSNGDVTLRQLPPDHAASLETPMLVDAIKSVRPDANIDEIIQKGASEELPHSFDDDFNQSVERAREKRSARREAKRVAEKARRERLRGAKAGEVEKTVPTMTVEALEAEKPTPEPGWSLGAGKPFTDAGERTTYLGAVYPILQNGKDVGYIDAAIEKSKPHELVVSWIGPTKEGAVERYMTVGRLTPGTKNIRAMMAQVIRDFPEVRKIVGERGGRRAGTKASLAEIEVPEHIVGPTVRGHSGKLYTVGTTHPQIMEAAVEEGVSPAEFEGIGAQHPNRGFKTNYQDFVTRDEAAQLIGRSEPLYSEDLHAARATPIESQAVAELQMQNVAEEAVKADPAHQPLAQVAMLDAAIDHAVSQVEPLDVATQVVKNEAELMKTLTDARPVELTPETIAATIEDAVKRGEDTGQAEKEIVAKLTDPQPSEIAAEQKDTPHERVRKGGDRTRRRGAKRLTPDQQEEVKELMRQNTLMTAAEAAERVRSKEAPIKVSASEQVNAPDKEPPADERLTAPKAMTGMEIASHLDDDQLKKLSDSLLRIARDKGGFITSRLLVASAGGLMDTVAVTDDDMPDWARASLFTLGSFLMFSAMHPRLREWVTETKFTRHMISLHSPEKLMGSEVAGDFRKLQEAMTGSDFLAEAQKRSLEKIFPTEESRRALQFVVDEGDKAPEMSALDKDQQAAALNLNQIYIRLGLWKRGSMLVKSDFDQAYARIVLPPETYDRWKSHGWKINAEGKRVRITRLRELQAFAQKQGLPEPYNDAIRVISQHLKETYHGIAANNLGQMLTKKNIIQDLPLEPPEGWRQIVAPGFNKKMAPTEVAQALENLSNPALSDKPWLNALDTLKGVFMRTIMLFPWEHGLNALRAWAVSGSGIRGIGRAWDAIRDLDPGLVEAVNHGLNLFDRPDFGAQAHQAYEVLLSKTKIPALANLGKSFDAQLHRWEKTLWDQWIPTMQYFTYAERMRVWAEQRGGNFLKSSPEYIAAARAAADYANTTLGKLPGHLTDPTLARNMRLMMFSPRWTMTRAAMIVHASGELSDIMDGKISLRDASYLRLKMRQVAFTVAGTTLLSLALSGQPPQFNPNTNKFYARTGWKNAKGQEMGLDLTGWWQSDLKLFNHPLDYAVSRLNPVIEVTAETMLGRDYLGRQMTTGSTIQNIIDAFGPLAQVPEAGIKAISGAVSGKGVSPGDVLKSVSGIGATGNVATLPLPIDATISRFAKKLLLRQGLIASNDNIFALSKLIRTNVLEGHDLVDGRVINYLGYQRRNEEMKAGIGTTIDHMWQYAKKVVRGLY